MDPGGLAKEFQVLLMMQIGPEEIDISLFDEILDKLPGFRAVMAAKGHQVELKKTAGIPQLVIPALVGAEVQVSFGMGQYWLIAFQLQLEENLFDIHGGDGKGELYQHQLVL